MHDGHFRLVLFLARRQTAGRGVDALDHLAHLGLGFLGCFAAAQQHTGVQVAAVHAGAGHDQIAHAGQAREGFRLAAHGQTQPGQLGVAAGDKGGLGVIAVAQAQCDADGQRNDV